MGWQEDLAREKDPWLRQHIPAAASRRNIPAKEPGDDAKSAFLRARGDAGQMYRDVTNLPVLREGKTMLKDLEVWLIFQVYCLFFLR